jgi:Activator of Hsp90 ATPase homolog 1-like protein
VEMPKPTEADKDRFRSLVPDDPRVEVKPMLGNLGAFVNGNMFVGARLVVTWGYIDSPDLPPGASTVEIVLTPDGTDTIVELTHRGLDPRQRRDHRVGWVHWLERLRIAAAGGDPGPDTPPARPFRRRPVVTERHALADGRLEV